MGEINCSAKVDSLWFFLLEERDSWPPTQLTVQHSIITWTKAQWYGSEIRTKGRKKCQEGVVIADSPLVRDIFRL